MARINSSRPLLRSTLRARRLFVHLLWSTAVFDAVTHAQTTTSAMAVRENNSLSTMEMLQNDGYTAEAHTVITEDGYILELHRITKSKSGQEPNRNHPVLVQHGILGSSADWILGGPEKSLPMQLSDDGYDVWLSNIRGNIYSRKHVSLTFKQRAFWNFCLHEVGTYDLPAIIDYILLTTNTSQLHYVGFSMGTSIFFIMASERPEYQPKIRSQISLAPVAYLSNTRSVLKYVAPYAKVLNTIFQKTSNGMFMLRSKMEKFFAEMLCKEKLTQKLICEKCIIFSVCGSDPYYFDKSLIPLIFGHFPAGTSSKLTAHFAQFMLKDSFCRYDYGRALNLLHYNSTEPPVYDLKSIQVPIMLMYGKNDILADTEDVMKLQAQLPKLLDVMVVDNPYCNHVDLMWSVNVTGEVNDPVRKLLRMTDRAGWTYAGGPRSSAESDESTAASNATASNAAASDAAASDAAASNAAASDAAASNAATADGPAGLTSYLDDVTCNLDAIIEGAMPRSVDGGDRETFERQRRLQTALYGNAISYLRSAEAAYGGSWRGWTAGVNDYWTNVISDSVSRGLSDVRLAADGVRGAGNSAADGVRSAGNSAADGVRGAAESVAAAMANAETLMRHSMYRTDRAASGALTATVRGLNKAFWFFR